jgi:hypothetical protein
MSDTRPNREVSLDRRDEKVVMQQAGYTATEQVTRDAAADQRMGTVGVAQIVWSILGIVEILLGLRFIQTLIAANSEAGFAVFINGVTKLIFAPYTFLVGTPTVGDSALEIRTFIAMGVYALLVLVIVRIIQVGANKPSARTVTLSETSDTHRR